MVNIYCIDEDSDAVAYLRSILPSTIELDVCDSIGSLSPEKLLWADCVIIDPEFEGNRGVSVIEAVAEGIAKANSARLVVCSHSCDLDFVTQAMRAGADLVLQKPIIAPYDRDKILAEILGARALRVAPYLSTSSYCLSDIFGSSKYAQILRSNLRKWTAEARLRLSIIGAAGSGRRHIATTFAKMRGGRSCLVVDPEEVRRLRSLPAFFSQHPYEDIILIGGLQFYSPTWRAFLEDWVGCSGHVFRTAALCDRIEDMPLFCSGFLAEFRAQGKTNAAAFDLESMMYLTRCCREANLSELKRAIFHAARGKDCFFLQKKDVQCCI